MWRGKRGGGEREGERGKEKEGEELKVGMEKGNSSSCSSNNSWILFFFFQIFKSFMWINSFSLCNVPSRGLPLVSPLFFFSGAKMGIKGINTIWDLILSSLAWEFTEVLDLDDIFFFLSINCCLFSENRDCIIEIDTTQWKLEFEA